ncbi:MAG: OmpA family protein [Bacteroidota bacterium]
MPRTFPFLLLSFFWTSAQYGSLGAGLHAQESNSSAADQEHIISIFFGGGSYYINPEQAAQLKAFLDNIPNIEAYEIEIQGHTDDIGNRAYNQRLSEFRAREVLQRLINYPLPPEMMQILPLGEDAPSFDNATWEGKLNNRRVDVILKRILF